MSVPAMTPSNEAVSLGIGFDFPATRVGWVAFLMPGSSEVSRVLLGGGPSNLPEARGLLLGSTSNTGVPMLCTSSLSLFPLGAFGRAITIALQLLTGCLANKSFGVGAYFGVASSLVEMPELLLLEEESVAAPSSESDEDLVFWERVQVPSLVAANVFGQGTADGVACAEEKAFLRRICSRYILSSLAQDKFATSVKCCPIRNVGENNMHCMAL